MKRRTILAVVLAAICLAASACQVQLTPDGAPYRVTVSGGTTTFTNTVSGGNEREALWASSQANLVDSTECARWVSGQALTQNGLAFRIKSDSGGWDSLVLERNVYFSGFWKFLVIYFHSGSNSAVKFDVGSSVDLGDYLGRDTRRDVYPLSICGQLSGNTLRFAVAKGLDSMRPVGTVGRGGTFALNPRQFPSSGMTGTYIAHIPPQTSAVVDSVSINDRPTGPLNT
jgi:hypothetical protein